MFWIITAAIFLAMSLLVWKLVPKTVEIDNKQLNFNKVRWSGFLIMMFLSLFCIANTSFTIVASDGNGHMTRKYLGTSMKPGQIIALGMQQGKMAEILPPGFQFQLLLKVIYSIEEFKEVLVPDDQFLMLTAVDGKPLGPGEIMSPPWPKNPDEISKMLDAEYFLSGGEGGTPVGYKGMQNVTLPPGSYRFNQYLFKYELGQVTDIESGFVGVVKSNIQEVPYDQAEVDRYAASIVRGTSVTLNTPIVPKGYKGIWGEYLSMGKHWMHTKAYKVEMVDTRVKSLEYQGGFTRRFIDLDFDQDGQITQTVRNEPVEVPQNAVSPAITVKTEGWEIPVEVRVQIQIQPQNAPLVVATVGNDENVEKSVITPSIRSTMRDVGGTRKDPLDFQFQREDIKKEVLEKLTEDAQKYGPTIVEVQLGEPVIPPELLVASRRQQISSDLLEAYKQEQAAQIERVEREKQRALGDQQPELVKAEIEKQRAEFKKEQMTLEGEGEKLKLTAIAEGQAAQRDVLGEANVMKLAVLEKILTEAPTLQKALSELKMPQVLILGGEGNGLQGASAILGNAISDLSKTIPVNKQVPTNFEPQK